MKACSANNAHEHNWYTTTRIYKYQVGMRGRKGVGGRTLIHFCKIFLWDQVYGYLKAGMICMHLHISTPSLI